MTQKNDPLSVTLPGTWQLVSRVDRTGSGEPVAEPTLGADPIALLFYDRAGHFAAQFMKRDRLAQPAEEAPASGANNTRARGGYDAYFGTYSVNDTNSSVTQTLVGALSPENIGQMVTRTMTVDGDTLTIRLVTTSPDGREIVRTLVWARVG